MSPEVAGRKMRRLLTRSTLVWAIAITQVLLLAQAIALWAWAGRWFAAEFAIPGSAGLALVGALIVSSRPDNRVGWFLLALPVPGLAAFLCTEYTGLVELGYVALPGAPLVGWIGEWIWTPSFGIGISMVTVRFPDGRVPRGWRFVDVIAIVGTLILTTALAWIAFPWRGNPVSNAAWLAVSVGLETIAIGGVAAVSSLFWRYRHGARDLRRQVKWMLFATIVLAAALVAAVILEVAFGARFDWALAPFYAALTSVPIAIGFAILKHHLFDIDLIISRTLVYVIVTGILGGLYIGVIELMQQLSILYTGQRSETAIVLTAFVVAGAFTPVQKWADGVIERRFHRGDGATRLHSVSASAESVIRVIDPHRFAQWLVDESVVAFEAQGCALYLHGYDGARPFHSRGTVAADQALAITVHHDGQELGYLLLGRRRGGVEYSQRDVEALKRSAAALGSALGVAADLGHLPGRSVSHLPEEPAAPAVGSASRMGRG